MTSVSASSLLRRFGVVIAWIVIIVVFTILKGSTFFTASNFTTILSSQAPLGILSLALLIPLAAGDYDLSVASVLTLASMVAAILNVSHGVPIVLAVIIAIVVGGLVGLVNASICIGFGIDPFIVTLGMGTFIDGITLWISNSTPVSGISSGLTNIVVVFRAGDLSYEFYYVLVIAILIWYLFDYTPAGRRVQIVGKGREVARLSGLSVNKIRLLAFVAAGALSAVAGVVYLGTSGTADPSAGTSLLLPAFAAVFLGSTTIRPGRFNPWGTLVAVYFLTTGITGLSLLGVSTFVQQLFYGGALIISVALSSLGGNNLLRRNRRSRGPVAQMVTGHPVAGDEIPIERGT
ncbi:ABC transporter permease [Ferrimicrobium acidiphilum]|uniref:ABC transporter permease n=1 Tax=Ferrimicrobium acidiphilum TaxID=121039 RepID=UPI0023F4A986